MSKSFHFKAHAALLLTNFFFGANISIIKSLTPVVIAPFALNLVRASSATILFWLLFAFSSSKASINKNDVWLFIVCGLTGVTFNQLLFIKGLSFTTGIHGALLMLITPIFITLIAAILLKEKVGAIKLLGLFLGLGGAAILVLSKDPSTTGTNMLKGDILIALNAVSYAVYMVLVKPLMLRYSSIHVIRWVFTFGFFMMIPFSVTEFVQTSFLSFTGFQWLLLALIVVCGTFLPYLFNAYALSKLPASIAGAYMYTQPIFATIIAMLFLGEHFDWIKALCGLMIFSGIYLSTFRRQSAS